MSDSAFSLLAPPIQRILWRMRWTELRPIQVKAIHTVLRGADDLIISAATASGKTEAAFLPILSRLCENAGNSLQALYVSPLKALINDQFRRLEDLCTYADIPVHRWHGDVAASKKRELIEQPAGVLLITPESLESLFINRSAVLGRMFSDLKFIVIDELHAFVGRERGLHLRSLLSRLDQRIGTSPRMLALSATLGPALPLYARWMRPDQPERVQLIDDEGSERGISFKIYGFEATGNIAPAPDAEEPSSDANEGLSRGSAAMIDNMYRAFFGSTNLIFANRKDDVEWFADALNERFRHDGRPCEFLVHHGSVSKEVREETELLMRGTRPYSTLCSSTLELGIDIGSVHSVGQIGSPWSVNSLVQRLGRSGRREGETSTMRMYLPEQALEPTASLIERLRPELLHAIALTELMLEKWLETPRIDERDLSTLVHQILSVLAETGGILATELFDRLAIHGAFRWIDQKAFIDVLRSLKGHDLVEQAPDGLLILGLGGQELVANYNFYSAFVTDAEYAVVCDGRQIGTLPALYAPPVGEHLLLAAKRWEVKAIDHTRKEILVVPAHGRKPPRFLGRGGEVQPKVRQKMRAILVGDQQFAYLNGQAQQWLDDARSVAKQARLNMTDLADLDDRHALWFSWTGTRIQRTIALWAESAGLEVQDLEIALRFHGTTSCVREHLNQLLAAVPTAQGLAARIPIKQIRKFDEYLTDDLLAFGLADSAIDLIGAEELLRSFLGTVADFQRCGSPDSPNRSNR